MKSFANELRRIRLTQGLTQKQLSNMTGVHNVHICQLEKGYCRPTLDTLINLADALHVTLNELVGRKVH